MYPSIRQAAANASLVVVGRNPSSRLLALAGKSPSVEMTGWVPDVRPYLSQAEAVVVPLRSGGGTRIKIPEAMAMAEAVVSTPIGAEGLPLQDNKQIRIAEYARSFADALVELLENARLRKEMARAERTAVAEHYSWEEIGRAHV